METKHIFGYLEINDIKLDPLYIPEKGIIIDKLTNEQLLKLPFPEMSNFFNFVLEFDSFKYSNNYQPKTGGFKKEMVYRLYNMVLYLNLPNILKDGNRTKHLQQRLSFYLMTIQLLDLSRRKNYYIGLDKISDTINFRELNAMYLIPWYYYRINNTITFNFNTDKFVKAEEVKKIKFLRKGGIIETNNVRKLICDHFNSGNNLFVLPETMKHLWPQHSRITYIDLITNPNSELNNDYDRIILHECHSKFLSVIKKLLNRVQCKTVWIVNSLELKYYFNKKDNKNYKTEHKLSINNLSTITNIWMDFDTNRKKIYKTEIIRLLLTKLDQFYFQVNYDKIPPKMSIKNVQLSELEKIMYSEFDKYYTNWKTKLTNDEANMYSFANQNKINNIEREILNSIITLNINVVSKNSMVNHFDNEIERVIVNVKDIKNKYDTFIKIYDDINVQIRKQMEEQGVSEGDAYIDQLLPELVDKMKKAESTITNYNKYLSKPNTKIGTDCPICYTAENIIFTQLICGHTICLECILNTLSNSNECPICKEYITTEKIAIISETIPDCKSNILSYLQSLNKYTYILTDIRVLNGISKKDKYNATVLDINNMNIQNILVENMVNKVVILASSQFIKHHDNFFEFFKLLDNPPELELVRLGI